MLDFNNSIGGLVVVLFMMSLITGFSACMSLLISQIWRAQYDAAETPFLNRSAKETPFREAA